MTNHVTKPSHKGGRNSPKSFHIVVTHAHYAVAISAPNAIAMIYRTHLLRAFAILACVSWGVMEFIALQRAHVANRKLRGPMH